MKLKLIKWVILWLVRNHKYLLMEAVIPPKAHIHLNPRKRSKPMTEAAYKEEQDILERRDEVDIP